MTTDYALLQQLSASERAEILANRRVQYETDGLDVRDVMTDPVAQWWTWHDAAMDAEVAEPNAATVATVDDEGEPDARIVLIRAADAQGLVFYTNYTSAKSRQLEANGSAALVFAWLDLHRQVRVRGTVTRLAPWESDAYFAGRPRGSQIGAWASPQSSVILNRRQLEQRTEQAEARFADSEVPRPGFWGGWRVAPTEWEFWQGRPSRLHDRVHYRRPNEGETTNAAGWVIERLAP